MTPSRKPLAKHVARGNRLAIARDCIRDPDLRRNITRTMAQLLREEVKALCSDRVMSVLRGKPHSNLTSFTWDTLLSEMQQHAPTLLGLLTVCTRKGKWKESTINKSKAVIGLCTALLCKLHHPGMSLVQKLLSVILYTGHSSKKVLKGCHNNFVLVPNDDHLHVSAGVYSPSKAQPYHVSPDSNQHCCRFGKRS